MWDQNKRNNSRMMEEDCNFLRKIIISLVSEEGYQIVILLTETA